MLYEAGVTPHTPDRRNWLVARDGQVLVHKWYCCSSITTTGIILVPLPELWFYRQTITLKEGVYVPRLLL